MLEAASRDAVNGAGPDTIARSCEADLPVEPRGHVAAPQPRRCGQTLRHFDSRALACTPGEFPSRAPPVGIPSRWYWDHWRRLPLSPPVAPGKRFLDRRRRVSASQQFATSCKFRETKPFREQRQASEDLTITYSRIGSVPRGSRTRFFTPSGVSDRLANAGMSRWCGATIAIPDLTTRTSP